MYSWLSVLVSGVLQSDLVIHIHTSACSAGDPPEKEMATHSSILAWRIPWTRRSGGLLFMWLERVGHDWATNTHIHLLKRKMRSSIGAQWQRICLPMQEIQVPSLSWEDPTCHGAISTMHHNWEPQLLSLCVVTTEAQLPRALAPHNERHLEKLHSVTTEKPT